MQIQDIFEQIKSAAKWNDCHSKSFESDVVLILQEFEKQIRKDQDKITRHKCAENVLSCEIKCDNVGYDLINPGSDHIDIDEAHSAIINTKSI